MHICDWALALEHSALGEWMRTSSIAYPLANIAHLLGLTLLIGPLLLLDLRLLGFARRFDLAATYTILSAWAGFGLLILFVAGSAMFAADATPLLRNPMMQLKLIGIGAGIVNALAFRQLWRARLAGWDVRAPFIGRVQAAASIAMWLTTAALGRLIAYA